MATEKRLIYLDEAIARVKDDGILGSGYSEDERIDDVCDMLECCHTVNAVEVVHGLWVDRYGGRYANQLYECSECKEKALYKVEVDVLGNEYFTQALSKYCPSCNAMMDGNRNGKK